MKDPILEKFLNALKPFQKKIISTYLFGSRARGTERPDSDYDILLVVSDTFTLEDKDAIYDTVLDILLETGRLVSLKVFKQSVFKRLSEMETPFMNHIHREGILLG